MQLLRQKQNKTKNLGVTLKPPSFTTLHQIHEPELSPLLHNIARIQELLVPSITTSMVKDTILFCLDDFNNYLRVSVFLLLTKIFYQNIYQIFKVHFMV